MDADYFFVAAHSYHWLYPHLFKGALYHRCNCRLLHWFFVVVICHLVIEQAGEIQPSKIGCDSSGGLIADIEKQNIVTVKANGITSALSLLFSNQLFLCFISLGCDQMYLSLKGQHGLPF